jgi:rsbT co-antagonist protein RsbR
MNEAVIHPDGFQTAIEQMLVVLASASAGDLSQRIPVPDGPPGTPEVALAVGINALIEAWREAELRARRAKRDLENKLGTIETQAAAIRELSTPVMEIWDDTLLLPVVGVMDTRRSVELLSSLLDSVVATQAKYVILDITGVEVVDTKTADYLLKVVRAAKLLGARCVLTGLSPAVAQTLVEIGADLSEVETLRNLKEGLRDCLQRMRRTKVAAGAMPA